jgi:undecaprenyl-diphosphatase
MDWLSALILGIVEGLTEFLPISSTGHLILVGDWLNFSEDKSKLFMVMIQGAAILAVIWEYRQRLWHTTKTIKTSFVARKFFISLLIAFIPLAVLGLMFKKGIEAYLFNPFSVGIALLVGGVIIWVAERKFFIRHHPTTTEAEKITWTQAIGIGFFQSLALIPGTSRSAATLLGGMSLGMSRPAATEFSFFLAIPTLLAATIYQGYKAFGSFSHQDWGYLLLGSIAAFISALLAVRGFIRWVSKHDLVVFAWYRIVLGGILIGYHFF